MEYINPPKESPENVCHKTFYSQLYNHELGYNIYLPPSYHGGNKKYPVLYHLLGWTENESSDIFPMETVYKGKEVIAVFPNSSPVIEDLENLPVEDMFINELIPHIESAYRTDGENRSVSGFSMGGGMAFMYAVKYFGMFSSVTAYAGTFHHYYNNEFVTVGAPSDKAVALYETMINEKRHFEESNILCVVRQNAEKIRHNLQITLHIGTADILFCDSEILHLHLNALEIPHEYKIFEGAGHELGKII